MDFVTPIDFQYIIKNLYLSSDEQKQSGERLDMLEYLRKLEKDLRAPIDHFMDK